MQNEESFLTMICGFAALVGAFALCVKVCDDSSREPESDDLLAPLLRSGNRVLKHRLEAAMRDAEAGFKRCLFCRFENYMRTPYCTLCGTEVHAEMRHMDVKRAVPVWASLSRRQKRARLRKEWLRKMDVQGAIFWYRQSRSQTTRSRTPKLPGFTLLFVEAEEPAGGFPVEPTPLATLSREDHPAEAAPASSKVTIELIPPDTADIPALTTSDAAALEPLELPQALERHRVVEMLARAAAQQSVELTETSSADPCAPTVWVTTAGEPTSSAAQTQMSWKNTLLLSARDFPTKYARFVSTTAALLVHVLQEYVMLTIRREHLLADSIEALSVIPRAHIHSVTRVAFVGEAGVDAGALQREWFVLLNQALADPVSGVFACVDVGEQVFYLNADSAHALGSDHLLHYFGAGRLVGRSLLEGQTLGFHLALPLLKLVLGQPVSLSDLEFFDAEAYSSLQWLADHDGVDALGLTFSVMQRRGDELVEVDLIENGRDVDVTDENKDLYLERRFRYLLFESVSSQLFAFLKGLYEVVPFQLLTIFDPEELDYVLCGSDEIDVDDWQRHTVVSASLQRHGRVVDWFWELVRAMPNESRRRLLHFATGSSRVPLGGFGSLTSNDGRLCLFTLKGVSLTTSEYIASRACFNRLDLPLYDSRDILERMLCSIVATDEFGFTRA